jgi:ABC-type multidrug transport system permease subunit
MIARLGLAGREEQLAGELSGGGSSDLRSALAPCPIRLLDESTAGVDPKARREFWNEIHALAAEGLTALVSTHYMDEAERCHEIAYIAYGVLLAHRTVEEVVAASHLITYTVNAANGGTLAKLAEELGTRPGIDSCRLRNGSARRAGAIGVATRPRGSQRRVRAVRDSPHARNNPAANTSFDIVPGLIGTILTMTMLIFTALSVTRELERGTMESLLSMPIAPVEIMLGRVSPYIIVGLVQAALILGLGIGLFGIPLLGSLGVLGLLSTSFITANLSIGYTFSTIAQNQVQAMQMSMMFFLPNILLSGFMFPFAGMPNWAQWIGELLPLTHYLRIVRAIMLKGASLPEGACRCPALAGLTLVAMSIAITRFGRTLD